VSYSNYLETSLLQHFFGRVTFTPANTLYLALTTSEPTEVGVISEPASASGYYRIPIDNTQLSSSGWSVVSSDPTGYSLHNYGALTFGTASGDWGTITHFAVYDSLTEGNMYGYGSVNIPKFIESGDIPQWPSGNLVIKLF